MSLAPAAPPEAHNLFFAIRPPEEVRRRIARATAALPIGGRPMRPDRLHVTLLMLAQCAALPDGLAEEAAEVAASVRAAPFRVVFDWLVAGARSTLLQPGEPLEALRLFRERLGFALMRAGLDFRLDGGFSPHVTLLYGNEMEFRMEIDPIVWTVEDFVLIDSHVGLTRHVELGRWRLG